MRTDCQAGDRTARGAQSSSLSTYAKTTASLPARILGFMLLAGAFLLVAPVSHAFAEGPAVAASQATDVVGLDRTHGAALISNQRAPGGLPFARVDVAVLLVGGAIITLVSAAAPFLFGPLRLDRPLAMRAASAATPLVAPSEQVAPAHVPA